MKEPLYRKVNTKARGVRHDFGGDFRNHRSSADADQVRMTRGARRGRDYTPLFRFLLSRVGQPWDATHREAASRLDDPAPIFWLVSTHAEHRPPLVRVGESSYYSGLYVDEDGLLRLVDPAIRPDTLEPSCACCTHTLNGVRFTRPFKPPA